MQRRSGRGQTAGTGRARGSASGIGEAASSKGDFQRQAFTVLIFGHNCKFEMYENSR